MALLCPRCQADLQERPAKELVVHGCMYCGGVWLDRDGVAQLGVALSNQTLTAVDAVGVVANPQVDETIHPRCPRCEKRLVATSIHAAGVVIDCCPEHGAWYDRHELRQVVHALGTAPISVHSQFMHEPVVPTASDLPAKKTAQKKSTQAPLKSAPQKPKDVIEIKGKARGLLGLIELIIEIAAGSD